MAVANVTMSTTTVNTRLRQFETSVDQFIETEKGVVNTPVNPFFDTAVELILAIGNMRVAGEIEHYLETLVDKVSDKVKRQLDELHSLTEALQRKEEIEQSNLRSRAKRVISDLSLTSSSLPKLTDISPGYATIDKDGSFRISTLGVFTYAKAYAGQKLTIGLNGVKCRPFSAETANRLDFLVENFPKDDSERALKYCTVVKATLEFPYHHGKLAKVSPTHYTATYPLYIRLFPRSPGPVEVTATNKEATVMQRREYQSARMTISREDFPAVPKEDSIIKEGLVFPTKGWKIASKPQYICNDVVTELTDIENAVDVKVELKPNAEKVEAVVKFFEEAPKIESVSKTETFRPRWGEVFPFKAAEGFHVTFVSNFDNKTYEFTTLEQAEKVPYIAWSKSKEAFSYFLETKPPSS